MASKERLEQYIKEDTIYNDYLEKHTSYVSDFDKFCIQHCQDIKNILVENEKLKEKVKKLSQWDCNKDTRNSRQRIANAKLIKENKRLKKQLEELKSLYDRLYIQNCKLREEHNITDVSLLDENYKLEKQLNYIKSGEYYNQLKFERDMLQSVVDNGEVSKEDKEFIDMTRRNTELLEQQKEFVKYLEDYLKSFGYMDIEEQANYVTIQEILTRYKEIIGDVEDE